jgi:hypothetical protein
MSGERTPEHRAADDALLDAIQTLVRMANEDEQYVVSEFVVVALADSFEDRERGVSTYSVITKDSGCGPFASPHHSISGLLHFGLDHLRSDD